MIYSEENYKIAKSNDVFDFTCKHCLKLFSRDKRSISKNKGKKPVFCCQECQKEFYKKNSYVTVKCEYCGKEKKILKSEFLKSKNKKFFCNHSCAASYNNSSRNSDISWEYNENGKTKRGYNICPVCGNKKYYTSEMCQKCRNKEKKQIQNFTLGHYIDGKTHLATKCNEIRKDARRKLEESNIEKVCAFCKNHEFDEILEAHHLKGILEHDSNVLIKEINDISNLVWLCPNHHAMLEKGLITL
jgi:hypothetical protein